ncbi:hypothetical protein IQ17_06407 [Bradyrhizobium daqingense]|uniref:Uncharacterized protein n=1 Tax=Bradyrhizobium daqingense TaxID=993502 RepID=A0A562KMF8_9BRAD|nr:hypothetical protein IQ17_06407 [Bradyrhizobium daqingense]
MRCTITGRDISISAGGRGPMRRRLIAWTILTCGLLAVAVWTVLGPPNHPTGPHLPSRSVTAAR